MSRALRLALAGVAICLLAAAFAVPSLYVPGVGLAVAALAAEGGVRWAAARARIVLELEQDQVQEGAPVLLRVRAERWRLTAGRAELSEPGGSSRPIDLRGGVAELRLRSERRGEFLLGPAFVRFADPFGIAVRRQRSEQPRLLVLPRLQLVRRGELERLLALRTIRARNVEGVGFDGLRPYRHGSPASRIHWLTVARTGTLAERRAEEDAEGMRALIVLDAAVPDSSEALDAAVRAAASLCVGIARMGGCSLLLPGRSDAQPVRSDLSSWPYLHSRLALVKAGERTAWQAVDHAALVIWVGARRPDSGRPAAVGCTVSPAPVAGLPALFTVAGCVVQPSGQAATRTAAA